MSRRPDSDALLCSSEARRWFWRSSVRLCSLPQSHAPLWHSVHKYCIVDANAGDLRQKEMIRHSTQEYYRQECSSFLYSLLLGLLDRSQSGDKVGIDPAVLQLCRWSSKHAATNELWHDKLNWLVKNTSGRLIHDDHNRCSHQWTAIRHWNKMYPLAI